VLRTSIIPALGRLKQVKNKRVNQIFFFFLEYCLIDFPKAKTKSNFFCTMSFSFFFFF
jgi:hypothetical protein